MAKPTCHTCVFVYWDKALWLRSLGLGMPLRPLCANHPDSPGRERETPSGRACRNYRPKPKTPDLSDGTVKRIPITGGLYAYVDAADYPEISRWRWHMESGYAMRIENGKKIFMHRQLMNPPKGKVVDHISGNRLDNTRANLHNVTPAENNRNHPKHQGSSSRYFGVYFRTKRNKWEAALCLNGRRKFVGHYNSEVEAARAYDRAAVIYFGDGARLNFPDEWPPAKRRRLHAYARRSSPPRAPRTRRSQPGNRRTTRTRRANVTPAKARIQGSSPRRARSSQPKTAKRGLTIGVQPPGTQRTAEGHRIGTQEGKRKNPPTATKKAERNTHSRKKRKAHNSS